MKYQIRPLQGSGVVSFGMSNADVRAVMGGPFQAFNRTNTAVFPSDFFQTDGVFAYYDALGALQALEFASPAEPIFQNVNLLSIPFRDAVRLLQAEDPQLETGPDSAISRAVGISLYAPCAKDDSNASIESVLVFANGYYD